VARSEDDTVITHVGRAPAPEAEANPCIVLLHTKNGGQLPRRFQLETSPIHIGRDTDLEIVLDGDSVSRRHAHLERRGDRWWLVDDRSKNGTYVNEQQIMPEVMLNNGDLFKVGPNILKYLSGADAEAKYHEEIYKLTILDIPTQAYNKRHFLEQLDRELLRARRYGRPLTLVMMDIDFFKRVNDEHGHLAGDYVLSELSRLIKNRVRSEEVFARYGGEEFVLLLPETNLEGARSLAENLRARVETHVFEFQNVVIPVTLSLGVAELGDDTEGERLIARADEKLYEAKRGGRNRVA
jgi:diguanylate cyclase (GGDEF)-like protein